MTKIEIPTNERTQCEGWTRVMGYHRPVSSWNLGKQMEHKDRMFFVEPKPIQRHGGP